ANDRYEGSPQALANIRSGSIKYLAEYYGVIDDPAVSEAGLVALTEIANNYLERERNRRSSFEAIALAYAQLSDRAIARQGVDQMAGLMADTELPQLKLAQAYVQVGHDEVAHQLLASVIESLDDPASDENRYFVVSVIEAYGQMGDKQLAEAQLAELLSIAEAIEQPYEAIAMVSDIAIAYQTVGSLDKAQQTISLAESIASAAIEQNNISAQPLAKLARLYQQLQLPEKQQALISQVYTAFMQAKSPAESSLPALALYSLLPQINDADASVYLSGLIEHARAIETPMDRMEALRSAAVAAISRGDTETGLLLIEESSQYITAELVDDVEKATFEWALPVKLLAYSQMNDVDFVQQQLQDLAVLSGNIAEYPNYFIQGYVARVYLAMVSEDHAPDFSEMQLL
ncbi:MAG: hypothetical protein AAGL17_00310, partial [Cyanobacteria bacterium J06576_12]